MVKRVAVVTGANKGIGFAILRNLCQKFDGDVLLTARNQDRGLKAVQSLNGEGLQPKFHQLDTTDIRSIEKLRDFLSENYGGLDLLVNNAGIYIHTNSTLPYQQQADATIGTNYFGTRNVCKILFPLLRPHARIVNLSSCEGMLQKIPNEELRNRFASPTLTEEQLDVLVNEYLEDVRKGVQDSKGWPMCYTVSKVAITAMTFMQQRAFDQDNREDIIVNAVHPGIVATDLTMHWGPVTIEQGAQVPTYLALLPANVSQPKGQMLWDDKRVVNWFTD